MKFGGTSLGTRARIDSAAARVVDAKRSDADVVVVVSAMAGETDRLFALAHSIGDAGPSSAREVGRGGSDATAVAIAAALDAECEIFTDVVGVLTIDPPGLVVGAAAPHGRVPVDAYARGGGREGPRAPKRRTRRACARRDPRAQLDVA